MKKPIGGRAVIPLAVLAAALAILFGALLRDVPPAPSFVLRTMDAPARTADGVLDINNADAEELRCLPGIGEALAQAILDRRTELGGFRSAEDVLSVPGVGPKTYEAIAPYITCGTYG